MLLNKVKEAKEIILNKLSKYWEKSKPIRISAMDQILVGQELCRMAIVEANKRVKARKEKEKNNGS